MQPSEVQIWNETRNKLTNYVFRFTRDKTIAEDVVQDVFLKVHSKFNQLNEPDKVKHWIFRITRNAIIDHFRAAARSIPAEALTGESDHHPLNDCAAQCTREMLNTLPDKYRKALELAELEGVSQLELATTLNISYSGAKSRVQRARKMLRDKMDMSYNIKTDSYGNVVVCQSKAPCECAEAFSGSCK